MRTRLARVLFLGPWPWAWPLACGPWPLSDRLRRPCRRAVASAGHRGSRDRARRPHPVRGRPRLRPRRVLPGVGTARQPLADRHVRIELRRELDCRDSDRRRRAQSSQRSRRSTRRRRFPGCWTSPATRRATSRTSSIGTKVRFVSETPGASGDGDPVLDAPAERQQRERTRPGHHGLPLRPRHRQDGRSRSASSAISASASSAIPCAATVRTTCWTSAPQSRERSRRASRSSARSTAA